MRWIEVVAEFDQAPVDWSIFVDVFERHGCENTLQTDSPPALGSAVVDVHGSDEVIGALSNDLKVAGASRITTRLLAEENWEENWKRFFHPREVGKRWLIRPTWEEAQTSERIEIVLDPGQAFGTGDHPTTRMCLELLETLPVEGARVADIGCGSGILSVAAAKLGAAQVDAVDIEAISVEVAKENMRLNQVEFTTYVGNGAAVLAGERPYDIVVSNIISATLIQIAADVADIIAGSGHWITSGVIPQNWPDVQAAAIGMGFVLLQEKEEDGWIAGLFVMPEVN